MNLQKMLYSNPNIYYLQLKGYTYHRGAVYHRPTERGMKVARTDWDLFKDRQEAIYNRTEIAQGDFVRLKDRSISRVTVTRMGNHIQVGGSRNSALYVSPEGYGSYSGSCGDVISLVNIQPTSEYIEGDCWIFSQDRSGAHRGVTNTLRWKLWQEV